MLSSSKLPKFLWIAAIKTTAYILNWFPAKVVSKTPFELFKDWKPSLRHILVWGCPSEVRIYNPQEKKLDQGLLVGISLDMPRSLRVTSSIVHIIVLGLWNQGMLSSLSMTLLVGVIFLLKEKNLPLQVKD